MKIIPNKEKTTPFAYLKAGDTFKYYDEYYMKIENKFDDNNYPWNAVILGTGEVRSLILSNNVIPINGAFIVEE